MNKNPRLVILDISSWLCELQILHGEAHPDDPMGFTFDDFMMLVSAITDVAFCPIGDDRIYILNHAVHLFTEYVHHDSAMGIVNRYIDQLSSQLTHTGNALMPALNPGYRSWVTSDNHLYVSYENASIIVQPEYTRSELLASIENGDFVNERTRREYGL